MTHTKKTALCGVFTGLSLALMWMGSLVPSMEYVLPATAGVLMFALVIELGPLWPTGVYVATSILSALLLPNKTIALFYIAFFGGYPLLRWLFAKKLPAWLALILKFAVFCATMIAAYYLAVFVFGIELSDLGAFGRYAEIIMLALGNLSFALYDLMILSSFEALYKKRWRKRLNHLLK